MPKGLAQLDAYLERLGLSEGVLVIFDRRKEGATMPRRIVDLSMPIENSVVSDPPPFGPKVQYFNHHMTLGQMLPFFPGLKAVQGDR